MSLREDFRRVVCQTSPFPSGFDIERAEGCYLYSTGGRAYLDFISGISVMNVGHSHPAVVAAVCRQASLYAHTMVYGEHVQRPQVELASELVSIAPSGLDCVYFVSTGAEANDAALKMAVKLTGRRKVVAFAKGYHGDTIGALSCFGEEMFRAPYASLLFPVEFLPFGRTDALDAIGPDTAAVLIEPVQGEAGIHLPPPGFLQAIRERCSRYDALLIFDEIQTGFGRTGQWFAADTFGVAPDMMTVAKAIGGGLPLGALIGPRDAMSRFATEPPFSHITTFGGNPISCAAGLASLQAIRDEDLLNNGRNMGASLQAKLSALAARFPEICEIRGIGLMIGVEMFSSELARAIVQGCRERGLILETTLLSDHVLRFSPPLVVTKDQCDAACSIFAETIESYGDGKQK